MDNEENISFHHTIVLAKNANIYLYYIFILFYVFLATIKNISNRPFSTILKHFILFSFTMTIQISAFWSKFTKRIVSVLKRVDSAAGAEELDGRLDVVVAVHHVHHAALE